LVTELPDHVSFAEGATLGVPGMTAHRCVFVAGPIQGKILLVTGGAGAVGHYAVQLATWAGARVIATVSSAEKAERARAGGAAHIIDYQSLQKYLLFCSSWCSVYLCQGKQQR
jgi:NADPH2:quinone reductase